MSEKMLRSGGIKKEQELEDLTAPLFKKLRNEIIGRMEEQYQPSTGTLNKTINYDNPTNPDYKRHVNILLKGEKVDSVEQYHANGGSHNQTINYDSQTTPDLVMSFSENQTNVPMMPLKLRFRNNICESVYTGVPIEGEDGQPLMVSLIDSQSGEVVATGPEASARVEIVVLKADFDGCLGESMTREEFKSKILTDGFKRLLTGNVFLDLKEGIGRVGCIQFSHTISWTQKCAYRLGAIVVTHDDFGNKIKEGFTDSFLLKDCRSDLNMKHYPPTLYDEVWRLNGIAKDGACHRRLREVNINTVQDLLTKLNTDPQKLPDSLGQSISAKKWEALVAHAQTCNVVDRLQMYSSPGSRSIQSNVTGQAMGLFSEFEYVSKERVMSDHRNSAVLKRSRSEMTARMEEHYQPSIGSHRQTINYGKRQVERLLKCEKMESEEQYQHSTTSLNQTINYDNPTTHDCKSYVKIVLKCEKVESVEQYHANSGSHNHTINYGNPTTDFMRSTENIKNESKTRSLLLQFTNKICQPVFTGTLIKGEDDKPLIITLIDSRSKEVVSSGPEAWAKVEIVVLEADFGADSWTREKFKSKLVTKEGNKRLLSGNVNVNLKGGIGCLSSVGFSHTKVWRKSHEYRLGAIVTDKDMGANIREGFTDPFFVKDSRLNLNKKHYPPTPSGEVWRLAGIAKDGPFHRVLKEHNINTVGDVWKNLNSDSQKLQDILGKGMSPRMWEALVAQVQTCAFDDEKPSKILCPGIYPIQAVPSLDENLPTSCLDLASQMNNSDNWKMVSIIKKLPHDDSQDYQKRAKRKWVVLFSVMRWFIVYKKIVFGKQQWQLRLSSTHHDLQALDSFALTGGEDVASPTSYKTQEGIGFVDIVGFSHAKTYERICEQRLGDIPNDTYIGTTVRGVTDTFSVKDRRLNLYEKHYPPTPSSEVWRLVGIAKDGPFHQHLREVNINTVGDLLKRLNTKPKKLQDVICKKMSAIKWEALVAHARTCKVDETHKFPTM